MGDPSLTFYLALGCCLVIASCCLMVVLTSRQPRLSRRVSGMTFWAALGLQTLDSLLTYVFDSYAMEFATVRGSWHLVALGTIAAIALAAWSLFLYIDGIGLDPLGRRQTVSKD